MSVLVHIQKDFTVLVASLCGALAWFMNQHYFDRKKQAAAFFISFVMGVVGADFTLEIINNIIPGVLCDERAVGAFFCSALILSLITNLTSRINIFLNKKKD